MGEREAFLSLLPPMLPQSIESLLALVGAATFGVMLIMAGLYVQRRGQLRTRQGAAVLASFAAAVGVIVVGCAGMMLLVDSWQMVRG
jgi:predicted permease